MLPRDVGEGDRYEGDREGMQLRLGCLSPGFGTDAERLDAVLNGALRVVGERHLATERDLLPLFAQVTKTSKPLLLLVETAKGQSLATLVVNRQRRGDLDVCAVKTAFIEHEPMGKAANDALPWASRPDASAGPLEPGSTYVVRVALAATTSVAALILLIGALIAGHSAERDALAFATQNEVENQ